MAFAIPEYSRAMVNKASKILTDPLLAGMDADKAYAIINNWRASHNSPLNTFQIRLRRLAKEIDHNCIVAQRIKRIASIQHKLERFPSMKLAQIQDIGGCRAILTNIQCVNKLVDTYLYQESRGVKHKLYGNVDDYIRFPKASGYRGVHLVYTYHSDRTHDYDGLKIEIQIRSLLQHAWATAVETVGAFIKQSLKSSQGEEKWLRFFALMGSVIALQENTSTVENTPYRYKDLQNEILNLHSELDVIGHLQAFRASINIFDDQSSKNKSKGTPHYYLLELDIQSKRILIRSYTKHELTKASNDYLEVERKISSSGSSANAVLVSTESIEKLKTAYPNYYLDTEMFLKVVKDITNNVYSKKSHPQQTSLF